MPPGLLTLPPIGAIARTDTMRPLLVLICLLAFAVAAQGQAAKVLEKMRSGKDLLATGQVSRANIMIIQAKPVLHVDIQATALKEGK